MKSNKTKSLKNVKFQGNQTDTIKTTRLFRSSLLYQTKEFFNNSTLHGVRYIAESSRPFGEKFMWFCFTSIGAIAALIIIFSLWEKFQTNPTITGLDTDFHNQKVVFPAVVICPDEPFNSSKISEFVSILLGDTGGGGGDQDMSMPYNQTEEFLKMLTRLSYDRIGELSTISDSIKDSWKQIQKDSLRQYVFNVAADCKEIFEMCTYKDDVIECCDNFFPIYIEHGFCFAFNTRYKDTATSEEKNSLINDMFETDKKWALHIKPKIRSSIFIHSYEERSGWDFRSQFIWETNEEVDVLISMKQTYTTDDARQLSINQRKCIFPNEQKLKYYDDDYTFTGCMRECRIKKSIGFCQCAPPFYRPSPAYQICNVNDLQCLSKYHSNITSIKGCRACELSCHNIVYDIEKLSKTSVDSSVDSSVEKSEPKIKIEYLTWPIVRYKREVLFGWVDLLVSFGGIAGLFLGFSLLSAVEIIYYFTLRACCMLYKNREDLYKIEFDKMQKPPDRYNLSLALMKRRRRSRSLPTTMSSKDLNPQSQIKPGTMYRMGTRFMKADLKLKNDKQQQIFHHGNSQVLLGGSNSNRITRRSSFLRPNFKLGKIAPADVYSNRNFVATPNGNFTYMP